MIASTSAPRRQPLTFGSLYCWACALLLWSYIVSVYLYKIWYIAAAAVCALAAIMVLSGTLRSRGLVRLALPVVAYIGYLFVTSCWAVRPDFTLWWATVDIIQIVVFGLFYLLALNCTMRQMNNFLIALMGPSLVGAVILWVMNPEAIRMCGNAPQIVACLLPFCLIRLKFSFKLEGLWPFIMGLAVVVISMSRAPLLAAIVGIALSVFVLSDSIGQFLRFVLAFSAAAVIALVVLLSFETTRILVAKSVVRAIDQPIVVGDVVIQPDGEDLVRTAIFEDGNALLESALPWGIGYMNFLSYFESVHRFPMPLHNVYQAVAVELGLPGLALGALLFGNYFWGLRSCLRLAKSAEERTIYKGFGIAMVCVMTIAVYHQTHQTPVFYLLYALVAGLVQRQRIGEVVQLPARNIVRSAAIRRAA